jgi:serine/threonine protein kinase
MGVVDTVPIALGRYELDRRLGAGGMGEVWLARRIALAGAQRRVAVKTIHDRLHHRGAAAAMFADEARISMLIHHPNVVAAFDAGRSSGRCYLAMEWIDGCSLAELMAELSQRGLRLPYEVTAYVIASLLKALAYIHALPRSGRSALCIVHNDVSPHNVLVSASGEVKLTDFGIAAVGGTVRNPAVVRGKPRYMAPEQSRGRVHDPRSDVFAVGVILHELLSGGRFREFEQGMPHDASIPELRDPHTPEPLTRLRVALLQPDIASRPTAVEALRMLERMPVVPDPASELGQICERLRSRSTDVAGADPGTAASEATAAGRTEAGSSRLSLAAPLWSPPAVDRWSRLAFALLGAGGATLMFILAAITASVLR